jgi:hypothetical protein
VAICIESVIASLFCVAICIESVIAREAWRSAIDFLIASFLCACAREAGD